MSTSSGSPRLENNLQTALIKISHGRGHMPFSANWTGLDALAKKLGLTHNEIVALKRANLFNNNHDGVKVDLVRYRTITSQFGLALPSSEY